MLMSGIKLELADVTKQDILDNRTDPTDGNCKSTSGEFALNSVLFLTNKSVRLNSSSGDFEITVGDLSVTVNRVDKSVDSRTTKVYEIRRLVARGSIPDLDLSLVIVNGDLGLYWRETYRHRSYRQGLFKIVGSQLVSLCEGTGGIDSSH